MKKYCFSGKVIEGQKLGRKIGFPTANLDSQDFDSSLKKGVYSAEVTHNDKKYLTALFFGPKTIQKETKNTLEVHILDFNENIYGETIEVCLLKFIRGTIKFSSVKDLSDQINKDILVAKKSAY